MLASVLGISVITSFGQDDNILSNTLPDNADSFAIIGFKGDVEMRGAIGFTTPAKNYSLTDITITATGLLGDDAKDIIVTLCSDNNRLPVRSLLSRLTSNAITADTKGNIYVVDGIPAEAN
jgi:hypothetical protein